MMMSVDRPQREKKTYSTQIGQNLDLLAQKRTTPFRISASSAFIRHSIMPPSSKKRSNDDMTADEAALAAYRKNKARKQAAAQHRAAAEENAAAQRRAAAEAEAEEEEAMTVDSLDQKKKKKTITVQQKKRPAESPVARGNRGPVKRGKTPTGAVRPPPRRQDAVMFADTSSSSEDEEENEEELAEPVQKKRRLVQAAEIAQQLAESGELFGRPAVAAFENSKSTVPHPPVPPPPPLPPSRQELPLPPPPQVATVPVAISRRRHPAVAEPAPRMADHRPVPLPRNNHNIPPQPPAFAMGSTTTIGRPRPANNYHRDDKMNNVARRRPVAAVIPPRPVRRLQAPVVTVEDVTDEEENEVEAPAELPPLRDQVVMEEPDLQATAAPKWTMTGSSSWKTIIMVGSFLTVVVAVLLAVVVLPRRPQLTKWNNTSHNNSKKMTMTTLAEWFFQGIMAMVQIITTFLWRRIWDWCVLLQEYPFSTIVGTAVLYGIVHWWYCRHLRLRRAAILRQRVYEIRHKAHMELYKSVGRPVRSDHIFSRIANELYPASADRRDQLRRDVWSILEVQAHQDPCILVRREQFGSDGRRRSSTGGWTWEWLDRDRMPTPGQAVF
jgi:hypothetical protein